MSTAQVYYELYKSLPPKTKLKVRALIQEDEMTVDISLKHLKAGLKELKLLKAGKIKGRPIEQLLHE